MWQLPRDRSVYFIGWPQCCLSFLFKALEKVWEQVHSGWPQSCFSACYLQHVTLRRTSMERPRLLSLPPVISSRACVTFASRQVWLRLTTFMLFCLLSSTCDVGGKTSIIKPPSRYLFTCPRDNCLETGVCTSKADLNAAYLSSLKPSKEHCGAVSSRWPPIFLPKCSWPWSPWPRPRPPPQPPTSPPLSQPFRLVFNQTLAGLSRCSFQKLQNRSLFKAN